MHFLLLKMMNSLKTMTAKDLCVLNLSVEIPDYFFGFDANVNSKAISSDISSRIIKEKTENAAQNMRNYFCIYQPSFLYTCTYWLVQYVYRNTYKKTYEQIG